MEESKNKNEAKPLTLKGDVDVKKKSVFSKISEIFSGDGKMVKDYIVFDVIVPSLKKIIQETVTNGIDIFLYGDKRNRSRSSSGYRDPYGGTRVSYRTYYEDDRRDRYDDSYRRRIVSLDNISLSNSDDAWDVIDSLIDDINHYGYVEVSALFEKIGKQCPYTYNEYGWNSLKTARVDQGRDGRYYLVLPRPIVIERQN